MPSVLEDLVAVALLVERERVLEARAAAAAHADAQSGRRDLVPCEARNSRTFSAPLSVSVIMCVSVASGASLHSV